jgi:hypothetical protein
MTNQRALSWNDVALALVLSILVSAALLQGPAYALFGARDLRASSSVKPTKLTEGLTASVVVDASEVSSTIFSLQGIEVGHGAKGWQSHRLQADGKPAPETMAVSTNDGLELTVSADGRIVSLTLDGDPLPITAGPVLWVRDMSSAAQVSEPNLVTNPGFEEGQTGWRIGDHVGTDVTLTESVSHSGDWSLQMHGVQTDTLGRAAVIADAVVVTPGERYRLSGAFRSSRGYVQTPSGPPPRRQDEMWRGVSRPNGIYARWLDDEEQSVGDLTLVAPLHWEADSWRRLSGEVRVPPGAAYLELIIGGRLQDEYVWVDDLAIVTSPEVERPVTGTVTQQGEGLMQCATITTGLTLTATYTGAEDHISVYVELQERAGMDRALEVVWGLPLDVGPSRPSDASAGWNWWDDVRHSRPISPGTAVAEPPPAYSLPAGLSWTYEHAVSGVWDGWLPISLYPYALVENGTNGLALAASLDSPRLVKLAYDQEKARYEARGYLGISPLASKLLGQADLNLELYRVDPAWGFRGAIGRFAARHPDWFESRRPMYDYAGYDRAYYFSEEGAEEVLAYDQQGIFAAQYIVAEASLKDGPITEPLPSYEETVELVETLGSSPKASEQARAAAITQSVAHNPAGDWMLKQVGERPWAPDIWEISWQTSTDPDIAEGWGPFLWEWAVSPAISATEAISAVLDGVMMDNFMTAPGVDTRPEHLALADTSLAYHVATYQPGVHNAATIHEFLHWLRGRMDDRVQDDAASPMAITVNFWGIGTTNGLARHVDAFGGEGKSKTGAHSNWNPRVLDYRRAIAHHKPEVWANGEPDLTLEDVEAFANLALFYGILPSRKDDATGWEAGADQLITDTREVVSQFWHAGWEPITHAWTGEETVWVERFGHPPRDTGRPLFFTVHNIVTETATFTLTVEATVMGIESPARLSVTELVSGDEMSFEVKDGQILIPASIEALDTQVLRLRSAACRIYVPVVMKERYSASTHGPGTPVASPGLRPTVGRRGWPPFWRRTSLD